MLRPLAVSRAQDRVCVRNPEAARLVIVLSKKDLLFMRVAFLVFGRWRQSFCSLLKSPGDAA